MRGWHSAVRHKLARLAAGGSPRVLDLFAGCGGLSLGFQAAGFDVAAAVENDPLAAQSHGLNFHPGEPKHAIARDIVDTKPSVLARTLKLGPVSTSIDVVVGGPPCQAFARVGRSKLREVAAHPQAFKHDARAELYIHYLQYVDAFKPLALLMENVPDVLNHGGQNIAEEVCDVLEDRGYVVRYTLLNAVHYGVPQMRERMFLVGFRREVAHAVTFPAPTHRFELPRGYRGSRQVALKLLRQGDAFQNPHRYVSAPQPQSALPAAVTAGEAIGDLPPITVHLEGKLRRGARRFTELTPYDPDRPLSPYASLMRTWPTFANNQGVRDHVIRYLPRDWKLFAIMKSGEQYPELYARAESMFESELRSRRRRGRPLAPSSRAWAELRAECVPPYDPGKFPNKWWKLWKDRPVRTLMAHLGKDGYSHIHYDSVQRRTISVREAARLQSFPDGFLFRGTMNPAFRQIGNAVPPLLAKALAENIYDTLVGSVEGRDEQDHRQAALSL